MKRAAPVIGLGMLFVMVLSVAAIAQLTVPAGTQVTLVFDQPLSSKTAKVGQQVRLHVANNVTVGRTVVLRSGTPVIGVLTRVDKRKAFGVNADMRMALNPVSVRGGVIALQPRTKGDKVDEKTGTAAGASIGGAALLDPIGLVGGYFVKGKPVNIKVGDTLETEVSHTTRLRYR